MCISVAKLGNVSLDVLVAVEAVGVNGEVVVEKEAEAVGRKSLLRILMQSWRNIMQEQWKQIDGVLLAALGSTILSGRVQGIGSVFVKRERGDEEAVEVKIVWSPASEEREDVDDFGEC
ncbi:hypothetical protein Droror1_Dr00025518 [Drosera rotundifolia]